LPLRQNTQVRINEGLSEVTRHSPCLGICKLDDATGFCIGCGRSRDEIANWISMGESERDYVWSKLPERLATLFIPVRLLPWTRDELFYWVKETVSARLGTWVIGAPGAIAEFPCTPGRQIEIEVSADAIVARATDASFRLHISDKVRAFAFTKDAPIVLGLPRARATIPSHATVHALGPDTNAIDDKHRNDKLFDFGIGRKSSRFCIRTEVDELHKTMGDNVGKHWSEIMPAISPLILSANPNRVVESAAARIEVFAPIPMPGTQSPTGAHTHFLPDLLRSEEEISVNLALPAFALPVAIFYPNSPA
jgi:predicted Fe-S protein YdhL (DUF1289 family)